MIFDLEDLLDFSFLSIALMLSMFIGKINAMLSYVTFDLVSDFFSLSIQILVILGLVLKLKKFRKK
jgi:hypothetical protein